MYGGKKATGDQVGGSKRPWGKNRGTYIFLYDKAERKKVGSSGGKAIRETESKQKSLNNKQLKLPLFSFEILTTELR